MTLPRRKASALPRRGPRSCGSSDSKTTITVTNSAGSAVETTLDESPGDFMKQLLDYEFKGQFGRSWDLLHPGHQAVVDRDTYTSCMQEKSSSLPSGVDVDVDEVYDDPINVEGIPERTSKAVTMTLSKGSDKETVTAHAVLPVDVGSDQGGLRRLQGRDVSHLAG